MKIGQYGMGRFGTFWTQVLADAGTICASNRSDRPFPNHVAPADIPGICNADALWLCNAISSMPDVCAALAPHLGPDTLVLDTCSVKLFPVQTMLSHFPDQVPILATHPMFGPDSARNGLAGLSMVLCPVRVKDEQLAFWHDYFVSKQLRVLVMTPDEHDREAARTQGLTHLVGRILAEMQLDDSAIATLGYRKIREVMEQTCNDPWQLFLDLQTYNPYSAGTRESFAVALKHLWEKAGFLDSTHEASV